MKETKFNVPASIIKTANADDSTLVTWLEFVFVDNKPNANMQGIPEDSFALLIDTGRLMPIKMEEGKIGGHPQSRPLGAIDHLQISDSRVVGKAALWNAERPSDIALLREHYGSGTPIDMSFEVRYSEYSMDEEGVEWILDPKVIGAAIVSTPAYEGRTPVLSLASKDAHADLQDECFAYISPGGEMKDGFTSPRNLRAFPYRDAQGNISETLLTKSIDALESVEFIGKARVKEVLESAANELKKEERFKLMEEEKIKELERSMASLRDQISNFERQVESLTTERDTLLQYKEQREKEDAEAEVLKNRLSKLTEAGFTYSEEEIEKKRAVWLALDDELFGSYVEELVSAVKHKAGEANKNTIPDLKGSAGKSDPMSVLREHYLKKE